MKENIVYILSMSGDLERIMNSFRGYYKSEAPQQGNVLNLKFGSVQMNITVFTKHAENEYVESQLKKIRDYFFGIKTAMNNVRINLLYQIPRFISFIPVRYIYSDEAENQRIRSDLLRIMSLTESLMITGNGTTFVNSSDEIILSGSAEPQVRTFIPFKNYDAVSFGEGSTPEQIQRRSKSIDFLSSYGIYVLESLPLIESESECAFRTAEQAACRMTALLACALYSECLYWEKMPVREAREYVDRTLGYFGFREYLSQKERQFLTAENPSESEITVYSWQYENLFVLLWALGFEDTLFFPEKICDVASAVKRTASFSSLSEIIAYSKMRPNAEILDEADLIYRLDWACVNAAVNNLGEISGVNSGVVRERHKSLNWLIGLGDWDNVDIST